MFVISLLTIGEGGKGKGEETGDRENRKNVFYCVITKLWYIYAMELSNKDNK